LPPNTSIASPVSATARLQFQNLAAGVSRRRQAVSSGASEPKREASSIASSMAPSDSSAMSASSSVITGWWISALPKAKRLRV